jgi:hypothetical protein
MMILYIPSQFYRLLLFLKVDFTPGEAKAWRGLELLLRGYIFSALTHPRISIQMIIAHSAGSTSGSMILRALRVKDLRLFEEFLTARNCNFK